MIYAVIPAVQTDLHTVYADQNICHFQLFSQKLNVEMRHIKQFEISIDQQYCDIFDFNME